MRKDWSVFVFGFVPALSVASIAFILGVLLAPPSYIVRGAFSVDWNKMPYVPDDLDAEKARIKWRGSIIERITKEQPIAEIADALAMPTGPNRNATISKLNRWLRVSVTHDGEDSDRFIVQMRDNDTNWASAVVSCVLKKNTSSLSWEAMFGSGVATLRSGSKLSDVEARENQLGSELSRLLLQNRENFSAERDRRCKEIQQELNSLEGDHAIAGLSALANLVGGALSEPVTIIEQPVITRRSPGYGLFVIGASLGIGIGAGMVGLILYKFTFALRRSKPPVLAPRSIAPPILP